MGQGHLISEINIELHVLIIFILLLFVQSNERNYKMPSVDKSLVIIMGTMNERNIIAWEFNH